MDHRSHLRGLLLLAVLGFLVSGLGVGIGLAFGPSHPGAGRSVPAATASAATSPSPASFATLAIPPPTTTGPLIELTGDAVGAAVFGQPVAVVMSELETVLGSPTAQNAFPGDCNVDFVMSWPTMDTYFFQGRLVGYDGGALLNAATTEGLRVGDTLEQAGQLDPNFGTNASGDSWWTTSVGGLVVGSGTTETPDSQIADISAGAIGCVGVSS